MRARAPVSGKRHVSIDSRDNRDNNNRDNKEERR